MGWLLLMAGVAFAQVPKHEEGAVARGKYIVEGVGLCTQCHTPVDAKGDRDRGQWLMGGPVQMEPTYRSPNWAIRAPRIAGGPPGTDQDFVRLMTTGISRLGKPLDPPMPPFRMTREDAEAVLAYLKSLGMNAVSSGRSSNGVARQ
jgi:mono/diheme cytochrome c family protein